jgi:osmotically-inducible protein OsmY
MGAAGAVTEGVIPSDSDIRDDVLAELAWNPEIASSDIAAAVKDGVVMLSGFVPSYWQKEAAERAVKRIEVRPKLSPTEIKRKIEEALW